MDKQVLLTALKENDTLDLYSLYQVVGEQISLYALMDALNELKLEYGLDTRLSAFKTQIERLLENDQLSGNDQVSVSRLKAQLESDQRGHSMSRYILATDGHRSFAPQSNLVMFGDSITEWGPWIDALRDYSLANRGLAGDTTAGMLKRIDTTLLVKPKLVCVMAGINDLAQGISVNDVFSNYQEMLEIWRCEGIDILVQSTLYCGERLSGLNAQVTELNELLAEYCQCHQLRFLNVNQVLAQNDILKNEYSCDDLHLTASAYIQWLEVLKPQLEMSTLN